MVQTEFRPQIASIQEPQILSGSFPDSDYEQAVQWDHSPLKLRSFQSSDITSSLTRARDVFVAKEKGKKNKGVVAYELAQDRAVYSELARHKAKEGYKAAKKALNTYTRAQIETHIGERLHVGISKFHFYIEDGELLTEDTGEPMLEMMKRGRDYRRTHGEQVDWARESAEVYGFEETQSVLTDPETPVGTMMVSFSPRGDITNGSIYKMNFYDVYQKTEDGVVAYRFTSGLTPAESQEKIREFDLRYANDSVPTDTQFLARPIRFDPATSPFKTPQEIHAYLHKEHEFMSQEEFQQVIEICTPMITSLINSLCDNPDAFAEHEKYEKILLNAVDEVVEGKQIQVFVGGKSNLYVRAWNPTLADINRLLGKDIRQVDTGCGSSGGSAASVSEFGQNGGYSGENAKNDPSLCKCGRSDGPHFHCPGELEVNGEKIACNNAIKVGKGISSCDKCGEGKKC